MFAKLLNFILNLFWRRFTTRLQQFFLYCVGGGLAFIVDIACLYIFTEYLHIWYLISATMSFVIAAIFNYLFQRYITFRSPNTSIGRQFFSFIIIAIVGLLINNTLLYLLVEKAHVWYIYAKTLAAALVLIWNFVANKKFTFK